jgi:predicted transcriptional regulator
VKSPKHAVLKMIQALPEDCTMEDIQYHVDFMALIQQRMKEADEGRALSQEEMERRIEEWSKSTPQSP